MKLIPFSCFSFIRKEDNNWVSLGLIRDDKANDFQRYDYSLPSSDIDSTKAEILAICCLADTARLILPVSARDNLMVNWFVSCQETKDAIEQDKEALTKINAACHNWQIVLMDKEQKLTFKQELNA